MGKQLKKWAKKGELPIKEEQIRTSFKFIDGIRGALRNGLDRVKRAVDAGTLTLKMRQMALQEMKLEQIKKKRLWKLRRKARKRAKKRLKNLTTTLILLSRKKSRNHINIKSLIPAPNPRRSRKKRRNSGSQISLI